VTPLCVAGAVLLTLIPRAHAWETTFGDCTFSGPETGGGALVRTGSCPDDSGSLELINKQITSVPENSFEGMGEMT